ncbi:hypothetical protein C8Q77DRAFT_796920 [Trametes polyzona]|nr:hypothetical protein C8Q77DRAFT_796920 [Trametes polyzona]
MRLVARSQTHGFCARTGSNFTPSAAPPRLYVNRQWDEPEQLSSTAPSSRSPSRDFGRLPSLSLRVLRRTPLPVSVGLPVRSLEEGFPLRSRGLPTTAAPEPGPLSGGRATHMRDDPGFVPDDVSNQLSSRRRTLGVGCSLLATGGRPALDVRPGSVPNVPAYTLLAALGQRDAAIRSLPPSARGELRTRACAPTIFRVHASAAQIDASWRQDWSNSRSSLLPVPCCVTVQRRYGPPEGGMDTGNHTISLSSASEASLPILAGVQQLRSKSPRQTPLLTCHARPPPWSAGWDTHKSQRSCTGHLGF